MSSTWGLRQPGEQQVLYYFLHAPKQTFTDRSKEQNYLSIIVFVEVKHTFDKIPLYAEENVMGKKTHKSGGLDTASEDPVSLTLNLFECLESLANTLAKNPKDPSFFLRFSVILKVKKEETVSRIGTASEKYNLRKYLRKATICFLLT